MCQWVLFSVRHGRSSGCSLQRWSSWRSSPVSQPGCHASSRLYPDAYVAFCAAVLMHAKEEQVHGMLIGCAEWFFNAAELCKISVEVWMSANGMVRPCPCPASDKLARGAKTRSMPWLRHRVRLP